MQYFNFSFHFIFFKLKYCIWTTFKMQILSVFKFLFIYLLEKIKEVIYKLPEVRSYLEIC